MGDDNHSIVFFFQAEDGIRDLTVTGVQTCALPISLDPRGEMDYTMIGDHVNLAARVEGLTRKFKAPIVITEYTLESIKPILASEGNPDSRGRLGHVLIQGLGTVQVKGKDRPVVVYSLRTLAHNEPSRIVESENLAPQEIGSEH